MDENGTNDKDKNSTDKTRNGFNIDFNSSGQRNQSKDETEKLQRLESLSLLSGGIAHDINNILTSILGNVALAKRRSQNKENKLLLEDVEKACIRATDLTYQLQSLCKGDSLIKETATVAELISDSARFSLRGSKIKCETDIPGDLHPVRLDIGRISRVLSNIFINARQAMPEGGVINISARTVDLGKADPTGLPPGTYVLISIRDHGNGIPSEVLPHIFRPYYTTKNEGTGLGLSTALSVIKEHGGTIMVESRPDEGAAFYLYLPASSIKEQKETAAETVSPGSGRVLVIDDEEPVRKITALNLRELGYEPVCVADENAALRIMEEYGEQGKEFHFAIIDLTIPGEGGGKSALEKLRKLCPPIKTLVFSGYIEDPAMSDPARHGFDGSIRKPYTIEELAKAMARISGKK